MGDEEMNSKEKSARTASPQRNRTGCEATASLAASKWCKENTFGKSEVSPCTEYNCDYPYKAFLAGVAWQQKQKVKVNV